MTYRYALLSLVAVVGLPALLYAQFEATVLHDDTAFRYDKELQTHPRLGRVYASVSDDTTQVTFHAATTYAPLDSFALPKVGGVAVDYYYTRVIPTAPGNDEAAVVTYVTPDDTVRVVHVNLTAGTRTELVSGVQEGSGFKARFEFFGDEATGAPAYFKVAYVGNPFRGAYRTRIFDVRDGSLVRETNANTRRTPGYGDGAYAYEYADDGILVLDAALDSVDFLPGLNRGPMAVDFGQDGVYDFQEVERIVRNDSTLWRAYVYDAAGHIYFDTTSTVWHNVTAVVSRRFAPADRPYGTVRFLENNVDGVITWFYLETLTGRRVPEAEANLFTGRTCYGGRGVLTSDYRRDRLFDPVTGAVVLDLPDTLTIGDYKGQVNAFFSQCPADNATGIAAYYQLYDYGTDQGLAAFVDAAGNVVGTLPSYDPYIAEAIDGKIYFWTYDYTPDGEESFKLYRVDATVVDVDEAAPTALAAAIHPNPSAHATAVLRLPPGTERADARVYDTRGRLLSAAFLTDGAVVPLPEAPGLYLVQLRDPITGRTQRLRHLVTE